MLSLVQCTLHLAIFQCAKGNTFTKTVVDNELQKLDKALQPIVRNLSAVIVAIFDGSVRQKMEEGASNAASEAGNTCAKWGAPVCTLINKWAVRCEKGVLCMCIKCRPSLVCAVCRG